MKRKMMAALTVGALALGGVLVAGPASARIVDGPWGCDFEVTATASGVYTNSRACVKAQPRLYYRTPGGETKTVNGAWTVGKREISANGVTITARQGRAYHGLVYGGWESA